MKKYLQLLMFVLVFAGILFVGNLSEAKAATPYLSKEDITLNRNESYKLTLKNYSGKIYWSSSDTSVATVTSKGTVKAIKGGTAAISVRYGSIEKGTQNTPAQCTCVIHVLKKGTYISESSITLRTGTVYTLRKSIKKTGTWSSSNKKVAYVSSSGKVTAEGAGTCYVYCKIGSKKYSCKVTVKTSYATVTLTPTTTPYNGKYTTTDVYKKDSGTRLAYTFRSYMHMFEMQGGGTLILTKGTYGLKFGCFVPSNVTIKLQDGATIQKSGTVNSTNYKVSLFSLVPPSVVTAATQQATAYENAALKQWKAQNPQGKKETSAEYKKRALYHADYELRHSGYTFSAGVKAYDGTHDVTFEGVEGGKCVFDHMGKFYTFGIECGHCKNITVRNIQFKNMDGNHFIELNSSKNVLVENCTFTDDLTTYNWYKKGSDGNIDGADVKGYYNNVIDYDGGDTKADIQNKEAINIDTCDPNYQGFNNPWAYHDYTPCDNVTVQNCTFTRIVRPIGSHKYTCKYNSKTKKWDIQIYNTNIKILNNTFKDTGCNAITMCNWDKVTVKGNEIDTVDNQLNSNPYYKDTGTKWNKDCNLNFFYSINPGKKVTYSSKSVEVIGTRKALKQNCAICIFGGGADITITNNSISNVYAGIVALNLQNMNGAADNEISAYNLSTTSKNHIMNDNTFSSIKTKCNYFFCNDSSIAKFGSKLRSFSGKREYLESEYINNNTPNKTTDDWTWDSVLADYYENVINANSTTTTDTTTKSVSSSAKALSADESSSEASTEESANATTESTTETFETTTEALTK